MPHHPPARPAARRDRRPGQGARDDTATPGRAPHATVALPCRLVLADGRTSTAERTPDAHVRAYLRAIVAPQQDVARYIEFPRGRRINGELEIARWPREDFHDPADRCAIHAHATSRLARGDEMFCAPVPRTEPKPRKDAARAGRVLWVDIDRKSTALRPHARRPRNLLRRRARGHLRRARRVHHAAALPRRPRTSSSSPDPAARTATGASKTCSPPTGSSGW